MVAVFWSFSNFESLQLPVIFTAFASHLYQSCQSSSPHLPVIFTTAASHLYWGCQSSSPHLPVTFTTIASHFYCSCQPSSPQLPVIFTAVASHFHCSLVTSDSPGLSLSFFKRIWIIISAHILFVYFRLLEQKFVSGCSMGQGLQRRD